MSDIAEPILTLPIPPEQIRYDRDGRLDADLACVLCGHNLRGLAADGRCGECGDPVSNSLRGAALNAADLHWLERVRYGVACLAVIWIWFWLPFVWWLLFAHAVWCITTQDPARHHVPSAFKSGCLRAVAIIVALAAPTITYLVWDIRFLWALPPLEMLLPILVALANVIVLAALRPILAAASAAGLAKSCSIGLMAAVLGFLLLLIAGVAAVVPQFADLFLLAVILGGGFAAAAFLGTLPLLFRVWRLLETATVQSRALRTERKCWQRGTPGSPMAPAATSAPSA